MTVAKPPDEISDAGVEADPAARVGVWIVPASADNVSNPAVHATNVNNDVVDGPALKTGNQRIAPRLIGDVSKPARLHLKLVDELNEVHPPISARNTDNVHLHPSL